MEEIVSDGALLLLNFEKETFVKDDEGQLWVRDLSGSGNHGRCDNNNVPRDYEFPFTAWLRGLKVDFQIDQTTLSTSNSPCVTPKSSELTTNAPSRMSIACKETLIRFVGASRYRRHSTKGIAKLG